MCGSEGEIVGFMSPHSGVKWKLGGGGRTYILFFFRKSEAGKERD